MASGKDMNSINDPNCSSSKREGRSCNFNDSSLKPEENVLGNYSGKQISQPHLPKHHGSEVTACQDLHSSSRHALSHETKSIPFYIPQPEDLSIKRESSHLKCRQSSENVPCMLQDRYVFSDTKSKTRPTGNEDAVPHTLFGTKFSATRESPSFQQDLNECHPSEFGRPHIIKFKSPENAATANKQLLSERRNFSENRCNANQKNTQNQPRAIELSATRGCIPSVQQFAKRNMNYFQQSTLTKVQSFGNTPSANQQLISERRPFSENRCNANQMNTQTKPSATELDATRGSDPSAQQFVKRSMNRFQQNTLPKVLSSDNAPSANQQLLPESRNFSENRYNANQMNTQTQLRASELGATRGFVSSEKQLTKRNMNRFQKIVVPTQQQSWKQIKASQRSYLPSHQPYQSTLNIGQTASSESHEVFGNQLIVPHHTNNPRIFYNIGESSSIQNLPLESFQYSVCESEDIQSSDPQALEQSENESILMTKTNSCLNQSVLNKYLQDCELNLTTRKIPNQSIANQDCHSQKQPNIESKRNETQGLHSLPQTLSENPYKRQLLTSHSEEQFKRAPCAIPHAENQPSTRDTSHPLPGNSQEMDSFMPQNQNSCSPADVIRKNYIDLRMFPHPSSNHSTFINILVIGTTYSTKRLLGTFTGIEELTFQSPYCFAGQRSITRFGIPMTVSTYKMDMDLTLSIDHVKASCLFIRSTIMFVLNTIYRFEEQGTPELSALKTLTDLMRYESGWNVPIILVRSKLGKTPAKERNITYKGFKLKAKHDLSAYLECLVESREEVEAVMWTAVDVSFLHKFNICYS